MALLAVLAFVIICVGINAAVQYAQKKKYDTVSETSKAPKVFNASTVAAPEGLFYDKSHSWAFMKQNGSVKVGVDDFLLKVTGELTRVNLRKEGEKIRKGEVLASIIQDGKRLNLKAPISGTIVSQNKALSNDSRQLKSSPYVQGWLYEIEPTNWLRETQLLLIGEKHREWIKDEFTRLKDFLATALNSKELQPGMVALQDGGDLQEDILSHLEPEEWEMFQTDFLDKTN